ncbi:MAG: sensor histidine kinase [Lachnospiraceae bacterium]
MTCFCGLPHFTQMVLIVFTWLAVLAQLVLPLYRFSHRRSVIHAIPDVFLLYGLLTLLCFLVRYNQNVSESAFHLPVPALIFILAAAFAYSGISLIAEIRRNKREINEWSVKEAIDDLPVGLLFADASGHIILFNRKMAELSHLLLNRIPGTLSDITNALAAPPPESRTEKMTDVTDCYRLKDGHIYRFCHSELYGEGLAGFVQLSAHDETEIHEGNARLRESNEELKRINLRLRKMFARMEDEVREKESLNLKVWLHDTLGRSLLTIQDVKNSSSTETKRKLNDLKEAVGMLSASRSTASGSFEEAQVKARQLGVKVTLDGYIPPDTTAEKLIIAAVRECVTNCIRHARGDRVDVKITEKIGILRVQITNNGETPKGPITEGSGLSSLRRSVEASGGDMILSHLPAFALTLYIPRKENNL